MFSVTPEPAVSSTAYGPRAKQPRSEPSQQDGFAAMVDSNAAAASDTDRPDNRPPEAPVKRSDADDTRTRSDNKADAPQPKPSTAADSKDQAKSTDASTDQATTETTPVVIAPVKTPGIGTDTTTGDIATSDDATKTADSDAIAAAAAAAAAVVATPVAVVIPVPTAVGDQAAIASDNAQTAAVTATNAASAAAAAGTDKALADAAAIAATAEQPIEVASSTALNTAAAAPAPTAGKTKTTATPAADSAKAKDDTPTIDSSATAKAADQPANTDAVAHDAKKADVKHDKVETAATDGASTSESGKPASAPAEHRAPAVAAPIQNLQPDPGLQTPAGNQPLPQVQAANAAPAPTPAPQYNVLLGANTPVPLSGLAVDIALRAAGGNSRFEIRLDPAELGRIDVRLDVDKHGNVTSHLTVERPATLDMLRKDAPQLQQALQDAGLKTDSGGLQFSLRDQSSSGQNNDNGSSRNSQRLVIAEEDTVPAQVAGRTYGRMLGSSSGVDIRI